MNGLLWFLVYLVDFFLLLGLYRHLGRVGCFVWIAVVTILANIQVIKVVEVFGVAATLGNIAYASTFLATDILSENYGSKDARTGVVVGFVSTFFMMVLMTFSLAFKPAAVDFADTPMRQLFTPMPRVAFGSVLAYGVSQFLDVWCYGRLKNFQGAGRYLWLRNNVSTILAQGIDSLIFAFIAFWGLYPNNKFWEIVVTTYLLKIGVALLDTPFIYMARWMYRRQKVTER